MKIDNIQNNQCKTSFQAKVSQRFVNSMRGFINNGENRLKNNYKLTQKLEEYSKYGYDNYTIEMHQKYSAYGQEYRLIAVKDGDTAENGAILTPSPYYSYRKIFNRFMNITKYDFNNLMKKYAK